MKKKQKKKKNIYLKLKTGIWKTNLSRSKTYRFVTAALKSPGCTSPFANALRRSSNWLNSTLPPCSGLLQINKR
jgi:hypothetical protein